MLLNLGTQFSISIFCCPVVLLDSTVVNWYLVECEKSKWILTLVTGEPMEGIEEEKHTVVKWITNTQCEQTQASTQKTCFSLGIFFHMWRFPYKVMLRWSQISVVDCMGSDTE